MNVYISGLDTGTDFDIIESATPDSRAVSASLALVAKPPEGAAHQWVFVLLLAVDSRQWCVEKT